VDILRKDEAMKNFRVLLVTSLSLAMASWVAVSAGAGNSTAQNQSSTALERGYRTGYSDGYQAGYKDITDRAPRDYGSKEEYQRADRTYVEAWGPIEDYRDGYQQGFEAGYAAGYDRQPFNSAIPGGLARRGSNDTQSAKSNDTQSAKNDNDSYRTASSNSPATMIGPVSIPRESVLVVELENNLSTDASQRGDRFQARVVEPGAYEGAMVDGRVTRVKRPGRVKGVAELQLSFDQIRLPDNRWSNFHAEVIEVLDTPSSSGVGDVDREGGVKGRDSTKDDVSKVGATTGIGAIIGAIAGGGKGAAIGAAIGGAVGTGGVLSQRGKDVRLSRGQQLRIRTSTDTTIQ
jgi:hypothetical protein